MGKFKTETKTKSTESDGKTQVLEFGLGDEIYGKSRRKPRALARG